MPVVSVGFPVVVVVVGYGVRKQRKKPWGSKNIESGAEMSFESREDQIGPQV